MPQELPDLQVFAESLRLHYLVCLCYPRRGTRCEASSILQPSG